jgi:glycerol-3-phosphate acyltransferase PlsY
MIAYVLAAIIGYVLGSIPFGLLITRAAGLGDVRRIGSGNIGATNVLRTGRRELAALTLVMDAAKGAVAVLLTRAFVVGHAVPTIDAEGGLVLCVAGAAAFVGHVFPVWLGFKGGKGVATFIGVLLALSWPVGLIFCAVWLVIALAQKYSSLAALTAAATAPIFSYVVDGGRLAGTAAILAILLFYTHRGNILRLMNKTEPKIGAGKQTSEPS